MRAINGGEMLLQIRPFDCDIIVRRGKWYDTGIRVTSCSCAISETFEYQGDGTPGFQRDNFDFRLRGMVGEMFVAIVIRVEKGGGRY